MRKNKRVQTGNRHRHLKRRIPALILLLCLSFALSACGRQETEEKTGGEVTVPDAFSDYELALDMEFSLGLLKSLTEPGDDPATGNRSAGSPAESEAAEIIRRAMRDMGLRNVTTDEVIVDGWTFGGATLSWTDAAGRQHTSILSGYPTNLVTDGEAMQLVFAGRGTAADYEGLDVAGKLVLIESGPEAGLLRYPVYQAKLLGAKAVLAVTEMLSEDPARLSSGNIRGPANAPVFGIRKADSEALQAAMRKTEIRTLDVVFSANSVVAPGVRAKTVWAEIPGESPEVLYVVGHYDGYFHAALNNAGGIATMLGMAKALLDSGYLPEKTIRFVACSAGEWGAMNRFYDWNAGVFAQLKALHPDWAENAFAALSLNGAWPAANEVRFGIGVSDELLPFAQASAEPLLAEALFQYDWQTLGTRADSFPWTLDGIPALAAMPGEQNNFLSACLHSSADTLKDAGFSEDAFLMNHRLFGNFLLDLDGLSVRPMNFEKRFEKMTASLQGEDPAAAAAQKALETARAKAEELTLAIDTLNQRCAKAARDQRTPMRETVTALNRELHYLYLGLQEALIRLNWRDEAVLPHEMHQHNISALEDTLTALEAQDADAALAALLPVDLARYAADFDGETCAYFNVQTPQGTWAEGRMANGPCPVDSIVRSLMGKTGIQAPALSEEIEAVKKLLEEEQAAKNEGITAVHAAADRAAVQMENLLEIYFGPAA